MIHTSLITTKANVKKKRAELSMFNLDYISKPCGRHTIRSDNPVVVLTIENTLAYNFLPTVNL